MTNKKNISISIKEKIDKKFSDLSERTRIPKSRIYDGIIEDYGDEWVRNNVKIKGSKKYVSIL